MVGLAKQPREALNYPNVEGKRIAFFKASLSLFLDDSGHHLDDLGSSGFHSSALLLSQTIALMEFLLHSGQIEPCAQLYLVSCRLLGIVADNTTAMDLRVEASKCIGQIGSVAFGELLNIDFTPCCASDWLVLTDSCRPLLMTFTTTKVHEILVDHIKEQPQSESAQAALKAFQEVASTRQGSAAIW